MQIGARKGFTKPGKNVFIIKFKSFSISHNKKKNPFTHRETTGKKGSIKIIKRRSRSGRKGFVYCEGFDWREGNINQGKDHQKLTLTSRHLTKQFCVDGKNSFTASASIVLRQISSRFWNKFYATWERCCGSPSHPGVNPVVRKWSQDIITSPIPRLHPHPLTSQPPTTLTLLSHIPLL